MGYKKTVEMKFVRAKHLVTFGVGTRAIDLIESLSHVPPEATVDEVLDSVGGNDSCASIEFHEERSHDL